MDTYRVSEEATDPLALDRERGRSMLWKQRLFIHTLVTVLTAGLWLPVLIGWLITSKRRYDRWAAEYEVRIRGGSLSVGTKEEASVVPLDTITGVSVMKGGYVNVGIRGSRPLQIYGLQDPMAAARAILDARDPHVRGEVREEVARADSNTDRASALPGAGRAGPTARN